MKTIIYEFNMKSIVVSDFLCDKYGYTQDEVMLGIVIKNNRNLMSFINNMVDKGYLIVDELGDYLVDKKMFDDMKSIIITKGSFSFEARCRELAKQLMEIFPKGSKMNDNGTKSSYYWKCNINEVANKLAVFFKEYGDYDDEKIIEATKKYVNDNYPHNQKNMRILKYFIYKMEGEAGAIDRKSDLATMLTAIENGEEDYNSDWTMNLINE